MSIASSTKNNRGSTHSSQNAKPHRHYNIAVIGSMNITLHWYTSVIPKLSDAIVARKFDVGYGGKGGNICVMSSKLGGAVVMFGKVGTDSFGKEYVYRLKQSRVNTNHIVQEDRACTGIIQYIINEKGKSCSVYMPNANYLLKPDDIMKANLKRIKVGVFTFEIPADTVLESMKLFKEAGVETLILAVTGTLDKPFFELATIIVLNQVQLELATGDEVKSISDAAYSLKKLLSKGCDVAVVTLGSWGALFYEKSDPNTPVRVMVTPIDSPVDVSAAGDAFVGSLAYMMANYQDFSLESKIKTACDIARETVMKFGSQDSYPFKADVAHLFPRE